MRDAPPPLTLVVLWIDARDDLAACLATIASELHRAGGELLVVASVAADRASDTRARFPAVRWFLTEPGMRESDAWAIGLSHARGETIAFASACNRYQAGWIEALLSDPPAEREAVSGPVLPDPALTVCELAAFLCDYAAFVHPTALPAGQAAANNVAFRVRDLRAASRRLPLDKTTLLARGGFRVVPNPELAVAVRPALPWWHDALERVRRGRHYAALRSAEWSLWKRGLFTAGTAVLPWLLLARLVLRPAVRARYARALVLGLPRILLALGAWCVGEGLGYTCGEPGRARRAQRVRGAAVAAPRLST